MIFVVLCVFFGAITYAITGQLIWAVIVGSGWIVAVVIGAILLMFLSAYLEERDRKKKRAAFMSRKKI